MFVFAMTIDCDVLVIGGVLLVAVLQELLQNSSNLKQ